jgi:hypothetical protein
MNPAPTLQTVNPQGLGDEQLVDLALKGEGIAFRQIMQRHNRCLYRTVRGILGVQEVYIRAFQHLASFRRQSALGTWLTRIRHDAAFRGTRLPFLRAFESPIAIACLRLFTFPPLPPLPLLAVPRLNSCISFSTSFEAPREYFLAIFGFSLLL